jgi:nitrogen fixation NifU-like protein
MNLKGDVIESLAFQGQGCAISTASASMMTEALTGKTVAEAQSLFEKFHTLVTTDDRTDEDVLGKLAILGGVRDYPSRVKCATLAWHAVDTAIKGDASVAKTE